MTRRRRGVAAAAIGLAVGGAAAAVAAWGAPGQAAAAPRGPGLLTVEVAIEHSRFAMPPLTVARGTTVEFVVRNTDPIPHELVVGPASVHLAHEDGTGALHPPIPGEVSVDPGESGSTFYTFDDAGTVEYACHLPGHRAYGMEGTITVR